MLELTALKYRVKGLSCAARAWSGKTEIRDLPARIRIRVTFEGKRRTDIRFSALYLD